MAYIKKRGNSYLIRVSVGYDSRGKKITRSTTYKPEYTTATGKAKADSVIEKEIRRFADDFERTVKSGEKIRRGKKEI